MIRRWPLACALTILCLPAFGCDPGESQSDQGKEKDERTSYSRELQGTRKEIKDSLTRTLTLIEQASEDSKSVETQRNSTARTSPVPNSAVQKPSATPEIDKKLVTQASEELGSIRPKLDEIETSLSRVAGTDKSRAAIGQLRTAIQKALTDLGSVENSLKADNRSEPGTLLARLNNAKTEIQTTALNQLEQIAIPPNLESPPSFLLQTFYDWAPTVGIGLACLVGLFLLLAGVKTALTFSAAKADTRITNKLRPLASNVQKQHEEFAAQLSTLTTNQNDLRTRIDELEFELKKVARIARDGAGDGNRRYVPSSAAVFTTLNETVGKEEPAFPISTGDYLSKMQRSSNIVRPDFQNDILVSDPGGTGELVLIRDATVPDDLQPLFVVPRYTQFQTKQDFYTYYQKYYECAHPSAGDVWIIDPAVVSKVSGGWQLREKGVLEVR